MQTTGQILGKAHRLCEWLRADDIPLYPTVSTIPLSWAVENATKWHAGNVDDLPDAMERLEIDRMPMRLPAKQVLFECDISMRMADERTEEATSFFLCYDSISDGIEVFAFVLVANRFNFCGGCRIHTKDGQRFFSAYNRHGREEMTANQLRATVTAVERILTALACTNVRSVDNQPPAALNRKRTKQGKPPLFTYKTLHVLAGERSGTHNQRDDDAEVKRSLRLHFRRGHVRRIGDGRITWVQQCMVGNRRLGVVEKAYALEAR